MTKTTFRKTILALPIQDRVKWRDVLNASITRDQKFLPIPQSHKRIVRKRFAEYKANPEGNISHEKMLSHIDAFKRGLAKQRSK